MTTLSYDQCYVTMPQAFEYILPVNLFLSAFILLQNSIILVDYYPDRRKLVISLFMLIAVLDMILAFGTVLEAIPVIICLKNSQAEIQVTNLLYFPIAGTSYIISISTNAILAVTKTISIRNPFARINKTTVYSILIIISSIWIISVAVGFTQAQRWDPHWPPWVHITFCQGQWYKIGPEYSASALASLAVNLVFYGSHSIVVVCFVMVVILVVFVCMIIQMIYIRRYLSSERSEETREAYHVNVTVFLVSMLYVICAFFHFSYIIALVIDPEYGYYYDYKPVGLLLELLGQYTLPLINAAVFPLILILRKPSLKQKYRDRLVRVFTYPAYIWYKYCSTTPGYETL